MVDYRKFLDVESEITLRDGTVVRVSAEHLERVVWRVRYPMDAATGESEAVTEERPWPVELLMRDLARMQPDTYGTVAELSEFMEEHGDSEFTDVLEPDEDVECGPHS